MHWTILSDKISKDNELERDNAAWNCFRLIRIKEKNAEKNNKNLHNMSLCWTPTGVGDLCTLCQFKHIAYYQKLPVTISANVVCCCKLAIKHAHMVLTFRKSKTLLTPNAHFSHVIFSEINSDIERESINWEL